MDTESTYDSTHWRSKVEELRFGIIKDLAQLAFLGGKHKEMTWGELEHKYGYPVVDSLIAAAHAEGVAEGAVAERERIRQAALEFMQPDGMSDLTCGGFFLTYSVPRAALNPPEKEMPDEK